MIGIRMKRTISESVIDGYVSRKNTIRETNKKYAI
jgi:hypothetical protein